MGLWDHQEVGGRLGIDVIEGIHRVVLVHLVAGDLPGHDLAKQAV